MNKSIELREQRAKLLAEARLVVESAEKQNRNLDSAEKESYDKLWADASDLLTRAERMEAQDAEDAKTAMPIKEVEARTFKPNENNDAEKAEFRTKAMKKLLGYGEDRLNQEELRALAQDSSDAVGGYTVVPEDFRTNLIKNADNANFLRSLATVIRLDKAKKLTMPKLTADPADAAWTTEIAAASEDSTMAFGQFELDPNAITKLLKVSKTLVRNSALDIQSLVEERLGYKFGVVEENNCINGDGSSKPLGFMTASASGVPTSQDLEFASATVLDADTIKKAKFQIPQAYWGNLTWALNKTVLQNIALLKDGNSQYLLTPGIVAGESETLCGNPVKLSEYMPSTQTSGLYVGMLADFSQYYILDDLALQLQVLTELYATTNQIGYIGRREFDGKPAVAEAFCRLTMA